MRKFLFVLAVLFLVSFSMAQPPFQETTTIRSTGIEIEVPIIETRRINTTFNFHIHAHNASSGLLLANDTTNCTIHIYKSDGNHIIQEGMSFDNNSIDFEFEVNGGNFTEAGQYAVVFYCSAGGIGGFFEHPFIITNEGNELTLSDSLVRIFLVIFFIVLLAGTYHVVGHINFKKWNDRIVEKYKTRNFVKMVLSAIVFNIMKNVFIIYYLMGIPIILILNDLTYTYNIAGLILFMNVLLFIYLIGLLIVGIVFLSYVQEWAAEMWDLVKEMDWGIENLGEKKRR